MRSKIVFGIVLICCLLGSVVCFGLVITDDRGRWPDAWPKELEAYREQASTVNVAHGIQEVVHMIPFTSSEDFEKAWPHILKVKKTGGVLRLENSSFNYHVSGSRIKTGVMILTSVPGSFGDDSIKSFDAMGSEYVVKGRSQGKTQWHSADPFLDTHKSKGFFMRARTDIILIVDGEIVDLNRVKLPRGTFIIDNRFKD